MYQRYLPKWPNGNKNSLLRRRQPSGAKESLYNKIINDIARKSNIRGERHDQNKSIRN